MQVFLNKPSAFKYLSVGMFHFHLNLLNISLEADILFSYIDIYLAIQ